MKTWRAIGLGTLALWLALWPVLQAGAHHQRSQHANRAAKGWPLAPFELRDQHGAPLTLARLQGRWTFVVVGGTGCGEPCARVLTALVALRQRIKGSEALAAMQVLLLGLDPQQDTPERLRAYLAPFDAGFVAASGDPATVRRLVDDLALAGDADPRGALVLVGPDAVLRVQYLPPYDPLLLTADYLIVRSRR